MSGERMSNDAREARFDRVWLAIMTHLSGHTHIQLRPGQDLLNHPLVGRYAYSGILLRSSAAIPDPDIAGITWDGYVFQRITMVRSNRMASGQFEYLDRILHAGQQHPGAIPEGPVS